MKTAFIFPGQGSQFPNMGRTLYEMSSTAREFFDKADAIVGYDLRDTLFNGTAEALAETRITQPAIFLHSVAAYHAFVANDTRRAQMMAGHSLGEFSALVCAGALHFDDGLRLVVARAEAMQKACEMGDSGMAAVLGVADEKIITICEEIGSDKIAVANFNCPGQVVIAGAKDALAQASEQLKNAGAKRVITLAVRGAFHSPLMQPAREKLAESISEVHIKKPRCPIYQNVTKSPVSDPDELKKNLLAQLTSSVLWTQSVQAMVADGARDFIELGPGKVLQGLVKKIAPEVSVESFG